MSAQLQQMPRRFGVPFGYARSPRPPPLFYPIFQAKASWPLLNVGKHEFAIVQQLLLIVLTQRRSVLLLTLGKHAFAIVQQTSLDFACPVVLQDLMYYC